MKYAAISTILAIAVSAMAPWVASAQEADVRPDKEIVAE